MPKNNILSNTPANKDTYIILMNWSFLLIKRSLIWHQTCQWLDSLKNWPRWPWQLTYKLKVYCYRATITRFGKNKRKCVCYHKDCHKKRKKKFFIKFSTKKSVSVSTKNWPSLSRSNFEISHMYGILFFLYTLQ